MQEALDLSFDRLLMMMMMMYSFVNDLTEDDLQGPKHVEGPSQYSKYLCLYRN